MMCWMDRQGPSFFTRETGSCLLSTKTLADPAAPGSHLMLFFYPSDSIPAHVHHGYASPEANIHSYKCIPKARSWGKVAAQLWMGAKVLPYAQISPSPPERAGTKLYFWVEETKCI